MSKQSESVKLWRKNTKIKLVHALGGECQIATITNQQKHLSFTT